MTPDALSHDIFNYGLFIKVRFSQDEEVDESARCESCQLRYHWLETPTCRYERTYNGKTDVNQGNPFIETRKVVFLYLPVQQYCPNQYPTRRLHITVTNNKQLLQEDRRARCQYT